MESSSSLPCAACNFFRRKCVRGCVFAPYFPAKDLDRFIRLHNVFDAGNVAKILKGLSPLVRRDAVIALCFEADVNLRDPVNGCAGYIQRLQRYLGYVNDEIAILVSEISQPINSPAVDFLHQRQPLRTNPQNFSSPQSAVLQDTVYSPHLQMPDQSFGSQQVDGARYSGSESAAGPATELAPAPATSS